MYYSEVQTRGLLSVRENGEEVFSCVTVELPWCDNERRESCIPPGPEGSSKAYRLNPRSAEQSGNFDYPHIIVNGVPGRSYILFHRGNFYFQVLGCILPGQEWVDINGDGHPDVTNSTETLRRLRELVHADTLFRVRSLQGIERAQEVDVLPLEEPDPIELPDLSQLPTTDL